MEGPEKKLSFKLAHLYLENVHGVRYTLDSLRQLRNTGMGPPFVRIGGRLYIAPSALDAWVDRRAARGTSRMPPNAWGLVAQLAAQVHELMAARATRYTWADVQAFARERGVEIER